MAQFFDKYKKMRKDQKIDLADIENRTKINVRYLEAIEKGDFDAIQEPYLRLFLRAYTSEIGADPDVAVDELTEYLLKKEGRSNQEQKAEVKQSKEESVSPTKPPKKNFGTQKEQAVPADIQPITNKNQFSISPNIIKGILFIAAWVIIIIIIRNITIDTQTEATESKQQLTTDIISNFVDFEQLQSDYVEISSQQTALEIIQPYIVKIVTRNTLGIVTQRDSLNIESVPMAAGSQNTLPFETKLDIVLKHSNGVSVLINGDAINDIETQANPVRLTFSNNPTMVTIKHYSPIE